MSAECVNETHICATIISFLWARLVAVRVLLEAGIQHRHEVIKTQRKCKLNDVAVQGILLHVFHVVFHLLKTCPSWLGRVLVLLTLILRKICSGRRRQERLLERETKHMGGKRWAQQQVQTNPACRGRAENSRKSKSIHALSNSSPSQ